LLVASVDRVRLTRAAAGKPTTWDLPVDPAAGPVAIDGARFTVGSAKGPTLSGVLVGPAKLKAGAVTSEGDGTCFAVWTIQDGPAPKFAVEGEGLSAKVKVGERTVRAAGDTLVLE
jgi:hypothetical protein